MSANPLLTDWHGRTAWVVGASHGIGLALADALHAQGAHVVASARDATALAAWADGQTRREACPLDVTDADAVQRAHASLLQTHGALDLVVYAAGYYRPQRASTWDMTETRRHCEVNYLGAAQVMNVAIPSMLAQRCGHLSLIASVAGYRGLPQALAYGPTKAALQNLADGLHHELRPQGVGVSVVNPGFVQTRLTAQNDFAMPALITPEQAAQHILHGWARGHFEIHFPKRFTWWLKLGRLLPHRWYFALLQRIDPPAGAQPAGRPTAPSTTASENP